MKTWTEKIDEMFARHNSINEDHLSEEELVELWHKQLDEREALRRSLLEWLDNDDNF